MGDRGDDANHFDQSATTSTHEMVRRPATNVSRREEREGRRR
jgi:hypothetical protein